MEKIRPLKTKIGTSIDWWDIESPESLLPKGLYETRPKLKHKPQVVNLRVEPLKGRKKQTEELF